MAKVYIMKRQDTMKTVETIAAFSSKNKAIGYLLALMDNADRVKVYTKDTMHYCTGHEAKLTARNVMNRKVRFDTLFNWTYYLEEMEVR